MVFTQPVSILCFALTALTTGFPVVGTSEEREPCDCDLSCADRQMTYRPEGFDNRIHELWYQDRFWNGSCPSGLGWWCFTGESWFDLIHNVLARVEPSQRSMMCRRLFRLGTKIGYEWARDNAIRKIDSEQLKCWVAKLKSAGDPIGALNIVEREAAQCLIESRCEC